MSGIGWFAIGAVVGLAAAWHLKPATRDSCCDRVAAGARERAGEACGPLAGLCQKAGDALDLWDHTPDLLDLFGVSP